MFEYVPFEATPGLPNYPRDAAIDGRSVPNSQKMSRNCSKREAKPTFTARFSCFPSTCCTISMHPAASCVRIRLQSGVRIDYDEVLLCYHKGST